MSELSTLRELSTYRTMYSELLLDANCKGISISLRPAYMHTTTSILQ